MRVNPSPLTPKWEVKIERGDGPATYELVIKSTVLNEITTHRHHGCVDGWELVENEIDEGTDAVISNGVHWVSKILMGRIDNSGGDLDGSSLDLRSLVRGGIK